MPQKNPGSEFLDQLLKTPERAIEQLELVYVEESKFCISRKKHGRGFTYLKNGIRIKDDKQLKRIKKLVIPPAWKEVCITDLTNGHLQATGHDDKGRKQYLYHPIWRKVRDQSKFYKMTAFGDQLPSIRKRISTDLNQKGWPKTKVLALVIRLMETTQIRVGSTQYARENNSYGLSTLRKKHVIHDKDSIFFEFKGKKGIRHCVGLEDKKLVELVKQCEEIPGWELFQYFEADGDKYSIDSGMVNEYLHDTSGEFFTAKDFRTWWASLLFFKRLSSFKGSSIGARINKNILKALDTVADELGNSRATCRKYYVHPVLIRAYEEGSLGGAFKEMEKRKDSKYFSAAEKSMLKLFKRYQPETVQELINPQPQFEG
jgi:DNA topoisomerase-1